VLELDAPFFTLSLLQAAVMAGAYGVALLAFLYSARCELRVDTFTASAAAFFVLFLVFPESMTGGGGVGIRFPGSRTSGHREAPPASPIMYPTRYNGRLRHELPPRAPTILRRRCRAWAQPHQRVVK
jgi:hypothetical protein